MVQTGQLADKLETCETGMLKYCLGISPEEHQPNTDMKAKTNTANRTPDEKKKGYSGLDMCAGEMRRQAQWEPQRCK